MRAYAPQYSQTALDALLAAPRRPQQRARLALAHLCRGVPGPGDYRVADLDGRVWETVLIDGVLLTYWIDHPVRLVMIGLIEWVD